MADEIDLEIGDPSRATPEGESRRRRRSSGSASSTSRAAQSDESRFESEISSRLDRVFDRIVKARRARDDEELAEVIEEDAEAMSQGFISLTKNVPFFRSPLILFLNVLEPILAFNRVGRILAVRIWARREERREKQEQQQAEWEAANGNPAIVGQFEAMNQQ